MDELIFDKALEANTNSCSERVLFKSLVSILHPDEKIVLNCRPQWLTNPHTGKRLEYDVYLPKSKVAIEVQGPTHFNDSYQMFKDNLKREFSSRKGIVLLEIGILDLKPHDLYKKLQSLKKIHGLSIKLRSPHQKRIHWRDKEVDIYRSKIKSRFGTDNDCYYETPISLRAKEERVKQDELMRSETDPLRYRTTILIKTKKMLEPAPVRIMQYVGSKSYKVRFLNSDHTFFITRSDLVDEP